MLELIFYFRFVFFLYFKFISIHIHTQKQWETKINWNNKNNCNICIVHKQQYIYNDFFPFNEGEDWGHYFVFVLISKKLISSQISSTYLHILFLCLFHEPHKPKMRNQRKAVVIKLYYLEQWWTCYSSYLISGEFWFNLCWFLIPFVSLPQKTKDIENQPRLKKNNLKSKSTCDRPTERVRRSPLLHPSAQCRYLYLLLYLQVLQLHPLQVECMHHDSEGLHSCIIIIQ